MGWLWGAKESVVDAQELVKPTRHTTPAGRYSVSVRLVEAKNLQAIKAFNLFQTLMSFRLKTQTVHSDRLPNVVGKVYLERAGFDPQKRKTVVEKETAAPLWNQLFYFDDVEVATDELEACNVVVNICDKSRVGKDMIIGSVDINLAAVYLKGSHEIWNEWHTLSDFSGRRGGSQGDICLCVTVLHEGDPPPLHLNDKFSDDEGEVVEVGQYESERAKKKRLEKAEKKALQKLQAEEQEQARKDVQPYILTCQVYNGREFPRMDRFGSGGLDAYLKVACGSSKDAKTRVITSANPDWNQEIVIRLMVPGGDEGLAMMPPLRLSVMDRDYTGADDHVSSTVVSLRDIYERPKAYSKPKWFCFYGGLRGMEIAFFSRMSKLAKRMNAGYVDGAAYRGRALLSFTLEPENRKNKHARPRKSLPPVLDKMGKEWHCFLHSQVMQVELFQTNAAGKMLSVDVGMGLDSTSSPNVILRSEKGPLSNECYANVQCTLAPLLVKIPTPFEGPLAGSGSPDVFVNINITSGSGIKRVGFCRIPVSELMPVNETLRPMASPTNAEFPRGWTVQGWFPLRMDALSNHKYGRSRRAENVKPIGQVLLRLMIRGSNAGKRGPNEELEISDDERSMMGDAAAMAEERREELEKKAELRGARVAAHLESEFVEALPTRPYMLRMELYQARNLPAADAHGSSDPFAVLRVGRNVVETQVVKSTTSPSWFREMFVQVDLPLVVKDKKRLPDGRLVTDDDSTDSDDDDVLLDPSKLADLRAQEKDSDDDSDYSSGEVDVEVAQPVKTKKSKFVGQGKGADFDGIAWWAAPSLNLMVFDRDEGFITGDNDPLSVLSLPLIHPAQQEADRLGDDNFSALASSILSFYSKFSLDAEMPERYDDICKYDVGALSNEPEWYPMRHLNPMKGLSVSPIDSGGYVLMFYELLPMPNEGLAAYVGQSNSFASYATMRLNRSAIRPLEDHFGQTAIAVEICVLGVRGLTPYRGSAVQRPSVEFELNGVTPLYYGSEASKARTKQSMYPNAPNANLKGEMLRLCGMMTKMEKVRLSLSIRVLDGRQSFQHIIATTEHPLRVRDSELVETSEVVSKLKKIKAREPTAEEIRARLVAEMSQTESESEFGFGSETTLYIDDSDTATFDTEQWSETSSTLLSARFNSKSKSMSAKTMSALSSQQSMKKSNTPSKKSKKDKKLQRGRTGRFAPREKRADAEQYHMVRDMDGKRRYIPLSDLSQEERIKLKLEPIAESDSEYDSDRTSITGSATESEASDSEEEDANDESDASAEEEKELASESESESEDEEDTVVFDDGTGKIPPWMEGRMMLAGGLLEDELAPLQFMSIPVYHAKGFADNTSEKELAGFVKCAIRSLPMKEDTSFIAENLFESKPSRKRATREMFNRKAKQRRIKATHQEEMSRWEVEEEFATMPLKEFTEAQRVAGGGEYSQPPSEVTVRIYVIRGRDLRTSDPTGLCDPYLLVNQRGVRKVLGKREDKVDRTLSPWFYRVFQFQTDLPGTSLVDIHVYDWEKRSKDILLGTCTIDIEDRFFSPLWAQELSETPPLEVRPILLPGSDSPQGFLELFVEIHEGHDVPPPAFPLAPPPVTEVELRCVTFGARKMVNKDVGGKNDLFFKITLVGLDRTQTRFSEGQETDTHWFATDGRGSFNFRNIFRFELPVTRAALRISAFDRDMFSANDAIGEVTIPLTNMCRQLMRAVDNSPDGEMANEATIEFKSSFQDSLVSFNIFDGAAEGKWLKLYHPSKPNEVQGEVEVMLSLLPVRKAETRPVGAGREAPNRDPQLREPVRARLSFMDPLGSLSLILGPELLRKILIVGCCLLFIGVGAGLAVFIVNDFIGAYIQMAIQSQSAAFGMDTGGQKSLGPVPVGR